MDYDSYEAAAYDAENRGEYRKAYGFWKDLVTAVENNTKYKDRRIDLWRAHMNECAGKM